MNSKKRVSFFCLCILTILGFLNISLVQMQSQQDEDRSVWDSEFLQKRPQNKHSSSKAKYTRVSKPKGNPVNNNSAHDIAGSEKTNSTNATENKTDDKINKV